MLTNSFVYKNKKLHTKSNEIQGLLEVLCFVGIAGLSISANGCEPPDPDELWEGFCLGEPVVAVCMLGGGGEKDTQKDFSQILGSH